MTDLVKRLNHLPPFLCRIMARKKKGWAPMSIADIAIKSGLTRFKVAKISVLRQWDNVTISDAEKFATGCGVDLLHPGPHKKWLRESGLVHITRAGVSQRRMFSRMMKAT